MPPENDSWEKHQELVLFRLDSLADSIDHVRKETTSTRIEVEKLKIKAGVWGALTGLAASVSIAIVSLFK